MKSLLLLCVSTVIFASDPVITNWNLESDSIKVVSSQAVADSFWVVTWKGVIRFSCTDSDNDSMGVFVDVVHNTDTVPVDSIVGNTTVVSGNNYRVHFYFTKRYKHWKGVIPARFRLSIDDELLGYNRRPVIIVQPASDTVLYGESVAFSVRAAADPPPAYAWKFNDSLLPGATSPVLTLPSAQIADIGQYTVEIKNSLGTITSAAAELVVRYAPLITAQPQKQLVRSGHGLYLSVVAQAFPEPLYQWFKNGDTIPGATSPDYRVDTVSATDFGTYTVDITNNLGHTQSLPADVVTYTSPDIELVPIAAGTFTRGYPGGADPFQTVSISAFKMRNTLVTQGEFKRVMGVNPALTQGDTSLPIENITWFDAVLFCNAKSRAENRDSVYQFTSVSGTPGNGCSGLAGLTITMNKNGYRLPTEAEWEYACKAGTTTAYYWGGSYPPKTRLDTILANNNAVWYYNSQDEVQPVGTKKPNPWGLYDIVGNVWEMTNVWAGPYPTEQQTDPVGPPNGTSRIARGSSWSPYDGVELLQSSIRNGGWDPADRGYLIGFRIVVRD
jgi:formylglycine-generating enzyme required for sulfatase activity